MVATVTGHLSDADMAKLAADKTAMANLGSSNPPAPAKFVFLAAFDGTNNDKDQVAAGNTSLGGHPYQTNVANIYDQANANRSDTFQPKYYAGVGTGGENGNLPSAAFFPTDPVRNAAAQALADFTVAANIYLQDNPTATFADLAASAVGFSRGAVTTIVFAQMLYENGLVLPDGTVVAPPGVRVTGLLPIDPVATGIDGNFAIPPNVEGPILVPRAAEDPRGKFEALDLSSDPRVVTTEIKANHTGAGGGDDKNGTGAAVLEGGTGYLQNMGVKVSNVLPENTFDMSEPAAIRAEQFQQAANGDVIGTNWPTKTDDQGNRFTVPVAAPATQTNPDGSTTTSYTNYKGNTVSTTHTTTESGSADLVVTFDKKTGAVLSQSKQETSADGLTTATSIDNGNGKWQTTTTTKSNLGDDGSFNITKTLPSGQVISTTIDSDKNVFSKDVTTPQPDGSTVTQHFGGSDLRQTPQYTTVTTVDDEGSKTVTTNYANGKTDVTIYNNDGTIFTPTVPVNTPQQDNRTSEITDQNTSEAAATVAADIPTYTPLTPTADLPPGEIITLADAGTGTQTDGGVVNGLGANTGINTPPAGASPASEAIETVANQATPIALTGLTPAQNTTLNDTLAAAGLNTDASNPITALPPVGGMAILANADGDIVGTIDTSAANTTGFTTVTLLGQPPQLVDTLGVSHDPADVAAANTATGALGLVNSLIGLQNWDDASDFSHVQTVVGLYNQVNSLAGLGMPPMGGLGAGLGFIGAVQNGDFGGILVSGIGLGNAVGSAMDMGGMVVSEAIGAALGMNAVNVIPGLNLIIALTNIEENPLGVVIAALAFIPVYGQIIAAVLSICQAVFTPPPISEGEAHATFDDAGNIIVTANYWMKQLAKCARGKDAKTGVIYYEFDGVLGNKYAGYSLKTHSKYDYLNKNIANDDIWGIAA